VPRDPGVFLDDIVEACRKIHRYITGLTIEQFRSDERTIDAVVRNLEVIGEAAKKLPDSTRSKISGIEWSRIAGLRDILIHEYFGIDIDLIWDIVETKVPELLRQIEEQRGPG